MMCRPPGASFTSSPGATGMAGTSRIFITPFSFRWVCNSALSAAGVEAETRRSSVLPVLVSDR